MATATDSEHRSDSAAGGEPETRERILRAAMRVVGEHGVEAVSNRRLAKEAGVALGSLTYHFPSQNQLLHEAMMLYVSEEVERLGRLAEQIRAGEPTVEEVAAEVERTLVGTVYGPEQIAELELHLQAARDPQLQDASRRCFAAYDEVAMAALEALGMPSDEAHARIVVALIGGVALRFVGTGERDEPALALGLMALARGVRDS